MKHPSCNNVDYSGMIDDKVVRCLTSCPDAQFHIPSGHTSHDNSLDNSESHIYQQVTKEFIKKIILEGQPMQQTSRTNESRENVLLSAIWCQLTSQVVLRFHEKNLRLCIKYYHTLLAVATLNLAEVRFSGK